MRISFVVGAAVWACAAIGQADSIYNLNSASAPTEGQVFAAFDKLLQARPLSASSIGQGSGDVGSVAAGQTTLLPASRSVVDVSGGPIPGDANLDNLVNFADLVIVAQNYGSKNASWQTGDFDGDHAVGFADLVLLAQDYGDAGVAVTAVPLPSAAWGGLALIGTLAGWAALRRGFRVG